MNDIVNGVEVRGPKYPAKPAKTAAEVAAENQNRVPGPKEGPGYSAQELADAIRRLVDFHDGQHIHGKLFRERVAQVGWRVAGWSIE